MRTARGFTLVEVLVAISVSALLVSIAYGAVRIGQRSTSAAQQNLEQAEVMRIGWQFMHDAIRRARPPLEDADSDSAIGFLGTSGELTFTAGLPANGAAGGLAQVRIAAVEGDESTRLILTRQRLAGENDATEPVLHEAVLVEDLESFEASYFSGIDGQGASGWEDAWETDGLPSLVRLEIQPAGGPPWPLLIARPAGSAPLQSALATPPDGVSAEPEATNGETP